jgi:hypothetical protein
MYAINNMAVSDKISPAPNGEGLLRTVSIGATPANTYIRIAVANDIQNRAQDVYAIDQQYYIKLENGAKPVTRQMSGRKELLLPVASNAPVTYSIIW